MVREAVFLYSSVPQFLARGGGYKFPENPSDVCQVQTSQVKPFQYYDLYKYYIHAPHGCFASRAFAPRDASRAASVARPR